MIKRVEINLVPSRSGLLNLKRRFHVQIKIIDEANPSAISTLESSLPSASKVLSCYQKWKNLNKDFYESLNNLNNMQNNAILSMICQLPFATEFTDYYEKWNRWLDKYLYERTNDSFGKRPIEVCKQNLSNDVNKLVQKLKLKKAKNIKSQLKNLKEVINDWLDTKDFCATEKELRTALGEADEIMVAIVTKDDLAWRLPWHFWSFFDAYINAGVVLSHSEYKKVHSNTNRSSPQKPVKVLAIVDNENNRKDLNEWKDNKNIDLEVLSEQFLDSEPLKKISDILYEQRWDILFFAGHSSSNIKNEEAGFYINEKCYLTINQLKNPLTHAINRGLQLAFFNSCDGLGLARGLLKLNLPKVIVMREDVPNKVAELFLKYFLDEFMENQGSKPTFLVVQKVREKLEVYEYESETNLFPGASLLPVICVNPATDLT